MKINVLNKNYEADKGLRMMTEKKLARISRLVGAGSECTVTFSKTGSTESLELALSCKMGMYKAESSSPNMHANVDPAVTKLFAQISKDKERRADTKQQSRPDCLKVTAPEDENL